MYVFTKLGDAHAVGGTEHYMAPDKLLNYQYADVSADMWSFGCIFGAWILRHTTLFDGVGTVSQLHKIAKVIIII